MIAEALAAAAVGLALLWLVVQPMVLPDSVQPAIDEPLDAEETPHGRALLALKEIEFDRATGKLSDEDFGMLHARYSGLAVRALEASSSPATGDDALESMIAARVSALAQGPVQFCAACGSRLVADAQFCQACGAAVQL